MLMGVVILDRCRRRVSSAQSSYGIPARECQDSTLLRSAHARSHRRPAWPEGQEDRRLRHRLAGLEPRREDARMRRSSCSRRTGTATGRSRVSPGSSDEFDAAGPLEIVEDHVGVGSTDFWGISFAPSSFEQAPMPDDELERKLALLEAAWRFFDDVAARVSPELREGSARRRSQSRRDRPPRRRQRAGRPGEEGRRPACRRSADARGRSVAPR